MSTNLFGLNNLDLLIVGVVVAATCVLGFVVYFSNKKSITSKTFLFFSLVTALWGVVTYFSYKFIDSNILLWLFRLSLFFAVFQAFYLYRLLVVFPNENHSFSTRHKYILIPAVILTSLLTLTPYVFSGIIGKPTAGEVALVEKGSGLIIFALVAIGLVIKAFHTLILKIKNSKNLTERKTFSIILVGLVIMFALIIFFNLIFATVFSDPRFVPLGALFTFPFITFTSYAILKQKLFNIKVAATAILVFLLSVVLFLEIIFADSFVLILFRSCIFLLVLIFGINLIRSVLKEVEQKEELAKLNVELKDLLAQRESLMHLINHKVKGSFTRSKYIFAGMLDGTFGDINEEIKKRANQGLESDDAGIKTIDLVLNTDNLQKGLIKYDMKTVDLKDIALKIISEKKGPAETKGIGMKNDIKEGTYSVLGDSFWLKEAINNLLENSIRYTKSGTITLGLEKNNDKILLSVKDTGIGITPEDRNILFTQGGRGKDSVKTNVDSTGYGLYSVKLIIDAHKGRVYAESPGVDKGSTFFIEFPVV
ncbi:hypothetical protein A3C60_01770 [Candidatus Nomurabacteria bacterium RIFCSPHIGHO2_02_FULL_37_45]|nr:MAG: hypothetical protein A3C60_01770 [Candidatus Nomurabacteria bacterium RIFCSPHIGHO2_02_FULL_37_45]